MQHTKRTGPTGRFAIAVQKAEAAQPSSILPLFGLSVAAATEALPTEPTQSSRPCVRLTPHCIITLGRPPRALPSPIVYSATSADTVCIAVCIGAATKVVLHTYRGRWAEEGVLLRVCERR